MFYNFVVLTQCQWDFSTIWRGSVVELAFSDPMFGFGSLSRSSTATNCYIFMRSTTNMSLLYQSLRLTSSNHLFPPQLNQHVMSNDTCLLFHAETLELCNPLGVSVHVPDDLGLLYEVLDVCTRCTFYNTTGASSKLREAVQRIADLLVQRVRRSDSLQNVLASPFDCKLDTSVFYEAVHNMRELGIWFASTALASMFYDLNCDSKPPLPSSPNIVRFADACEERFASTTLAYLSSATGYSLPPASLDECYKPITEKYGPLVFTSLSNTSSLESSSGIISLSSIWMLSSITSYIPSQGPPCTDDTTHPLPTECEEIPSYLCDSFSGCWIAWGPCQAVSLGYHSPIGTTSQIPCPPIDSDQKFIPGDAQSTCKSVCIDSAEIRVNGTCAPVPAGAVEVVDCDGSPILVKCGNDVDGFVFDKRGACTGRFVAVALGDFHAVSPESVTVQTWVRINSISLASGGTLNILPLYGRFGNCFIGIQYLNETSISILAFIITDQFVGSVTSDHLPHFNYSEWVHVAFVLSGSSVTFFVNGVWRGSRQLISPSVTKSAPNLISSWMTDIVSSQLLGFINREHFGPFRLTPSDLVEPIATNPWSAYLVRVFLDFDLFNPQILNVAIEEHSLGFFGFAPPGFRFQDSVKYSDFTSNPSCFNICLRTPFTCGTTCVESIWDPFVCECIPIGALCETSTSTATTLFQVVSTFSDSPEATSTTPATTSALSFDRGTICSTVGVVNDQVGGLEKGISVTMIFCALSAMAHFIVKRRRRVSLVSQLEYN